MTIMPLTGQDGEEWLIDSVTRFLRFVFHGMLVLSIQGMRMLTVHCLFELIDSLLFPSQYN